jgi:putative aldouronate transport system substrate-binding protein
MARMRANDILIGGPNMNWDYQVSNPGIFLQPSWGEVVIPDHYLGPNYVTKEIPPARTWVDTSNYHGAGTAIAARTRDPDRAMMAINLMNTDSYLATLMRFGVEGQHYLRDSQGRMVLEGSPRNSDVTSRGYLTWYCWGLGNVTIVNTPESYGGPNNAFAQALLDANRNASLGHMGFAFDQAPVQTYVAALSAVVNEYYNVHTGGSLPEDQVAAHVAEFRQKLRDNGVQRIIDEAQRQLNAWKAARR